MRPISEKRDLYQKKETYITKKRPIFEKLVYMYTICVHWYWYTCIPIFVKRDPYQKNETYIRKKRPISEKRPVLYVKETYHI